jgi:hypothetical protein
MEVVHEERLQSCPAAVGVDEEGGVVVPDPPPTTESRSIVAISSGLQWVVTCHNDQVRVWNGEACAAMAHIDDTSAVAVTPAGVVITAGKTTLLGWDVRAASYNVTRDWERRDDNLFHHRYSFERRWNPADLCVPTLHACRRKVMSDPITRLVLSDSGRTLVVGFPDAYKIFRVDRCTLTAVVPKTPPLCLRDQPYALAVTARGDEVAHLVYSTEHRRLVRTDETMRRTVLAADLLHPASAHFVCDGRGLAVGDGHRVVLFCGADALACVDARVSGASRTHLACVDAHAVLRVHRVRWSPTTHRLFAPRVDVVHLLWALQRCTLSSDAALLIVGVCVEEEDTGRS